MLKPRWIVLSSIVLLAAASRLLPHPWNTTPIAAMALFGGAYFANLGAAIAVPLGALAVSDVLMAMFAGVSVINPIVPFVYLSFLLTIGVGRWLRRRRKPLPIAAATVGNSLLFFAVTNLGVWLVGSGYPHTLSGLVTCYVAAIPFFGHTLAGDAIYSLILFGGFALFERMWPILREPQHQTLTA